MSGYTHEWLAERLAVNPQLRIANDSGPSRVPIAETATKTRPSPVSPVKARKYRNEPTTVDGFTFASKKEAKRYQDLEILRRREEIFNLTLQPKYPIIVEGIKICDYVADFSYQTRLTGETVVEDTKGVKTPVYRLKRKLVKAVYGIEILET